MAVYIIRPVLFEDIFGTVFELVIVPDIYVQLGYCIYTCNYSYFSFNVIV